MKFGVFVNGGSFLMERKRRYVLDVMVNTVTDIIELKNIGQ